MDARTDTTGRGHGLVWPRVVALAVGLVMGCSSSSGTRFTLFPEGHPLIPEAKDLRLAATTPAPWPRELDKRPLPPYTVEPGDVLLVVPPEADLAGDTLSTTPDKPAPPPVRFPSDQPILPDGTINLGKYGRLVVVGKTVDEIEGMVRSTVQAQTKRDPGYISVRIVTRDSKVYYVLGEVNSPGAFPLKGRETVLDGILTAGGLNDRASRKNIILTRPTPPDGCRLVVPICYQQIVQVGDTSTNYQLAPGDRVYVPSRSFMEGTCSGKNECGPCNRSHVSCLGGGCGCGQPAGTATVVTEPLRPEPPSVAPAPSPAVTVPEPIPLPQPKPAAPS